jgi:hypothetical protein
MQHITHQLIPRWKDLFLREVCVLIFKHVQIANFLHLCFLLYVTYVTYCSSYITVRLIRVPVSFLSCYWYNRLTQLAALLTTDYLQLLHFNPHPTSLYTSATHFLSFRASWKRASEPHTSLGLRRRDAWRWRHIQTKPTHITSLRPRKLPQHSQNQFLRFYGFMMTDVEATHILMFRASWRRTSASYSNQTQTYPQLKVSGNAPILSKLINLRRPDTRRRWAIPEPELLSCTKPLTLRVKYIYVSEIQLSGTLVSWKGE